MDSTRIPALKGWTSHWLPPTATPGEREKKKHTHNTEIKKRKAWTTMISKTYPSWPEDHCWYPKDRVPPHTSSKSKTIDKTGTHVRVSRGSHLLAHGSSEATTCLVAPAPSTRARGSSGIATCPVAPTPGIGQLRDHRVSCGSSSRHQDSRQLQNRHMPRGPGSHLLAQDSSGTAMCPVGRSYGMWAIKVNKYLLTAQPSWSPSESARVSFKALCDKDGIVHLQDVRAGELQVWVSTA
jgi:hypothetical protein